MEDFLHGVPSLSDFELIGVEAIPPLYVSTASICSVSEPFAAAGIWSAMAEYALRLTNVAIDAIHELKVNSFVNGQLAAGSVPKSFVGYASIVLLITVSRNRSSINCSSTP